MVPCRNTLFINPEKNHYQEMTEEGGLKARPEDIMLKSSGIILCFEIMSIMLL